VALEHHFVEDFLAHAGVDQPPDTARRLEDGEAVFENADHDFPRRIVYRRTKDGLAAHLEGEENGKARSEDFPMARVPCDAP
jgi:hypothetical protein